MFLHYKKNDNTELFKELETHTEMRQLQNFFPLYTRYFNITSTNWNQFNLNHHRQLHKLSKKRDTNSFDVILEQEGKHIQKPAFIKFSPLLDPLKYMIGKFKHDLFNIPKWGEKTNEIYDNPNNVAYVDAFFSYLSSQLLHKYNFINGIDFYGCYLGVKHNFEYNACDDLDYIHNSTYFIERPNIFKCTNPYFKEIINMGTRKNKEKLEIGKDEATDDLEIENLNEPSERKELMDSLFKPTETNEVVSDEINIIFESTDETTADGTKTDTEETESECSSRSSDTETEESEKSSEKSETGIESDSTSSYDDSTATEDEVIVQIADFPVQLICLEKLDDTLDAYLSENTDHITPSEWMSILFQIVVSLYTYQSVFNMTHNDLHTNNIMYVHTDAEYLIYKIKNKHYRVPTYNKIYKIIDFGRSIYTYQKQRHMSSSYAKTGDAVGQYNTEPYFNEEKRRIEPNPSFDLCRLACSLYDYIEDEVDEEREKTSYIKLIDSWVKNDKGKSMLNKSNGKERYPGFKLYKMIARVVHNHIPEKYFDDDTFSLFVVGKSKIKKSRKIINIDEIVQHKDKL
jgi:hypothetical protein